MATHRTITLKSDVEVQELAAAGTIKPGMLIKRQSGNTVVVHASAGQSAAVIVAVEDDLQGKEVADSYSSGNRCFFKAFKKGDRFAARIANGQNIAIGDYIESNGDGYFRKHVAPASAGEVEYDHSILAMATEACDMGGSSGVDPVDLCAAEVL